MDTDTLVGDRIADGLKLVENLLQDGFEVTTAFWVKTTWDGQWYFYIVSPLVETAGIGPAYGRLHPLLRKMPQPLSIDPFKVKLIGPTDPLAQDVIKAHNLIPSPKVFPFRWEGIWLGNMSIDGAYFYPLFAPPS